MIQIGFVLLQVLLVYREKSQIILILILLVVLVQVQCRVQGMKWSQELIIKDVMILSLLVKR